MNPGNLPVQSYHPTTFLERGVTVPFTTAALLGARARPAERGGAELIVPSPAGGRGVYILPWSGVRELCRPTVHDSLLHQKVAKLASVTPCAIRRVARDVAAEGLAGRHARATADATAHAEHEETLLTNFLLLMALVDQVAPGSLEASIGGSGTKKLEEQARAAVATIAPGLGRTSEQIARSLEEMAPVFAPIGVGTQARHSRMSRWLDSLRRLQAETLAWAHSHDDDSALWAGTIARVAEVTLGCAEVTLKEAHGATADVVALLRSWMSKPASVARLVSRPEWLLDGWEPIWLLWQTAQSEAARHVVLGEIVLLLPVIPREAYDWVGQPVDLDNLLRVRRSVMLNEDWRTGAAVLDRVARNEHLRALAA